MKKVFIFILLAAAAVAGLFVYRNTNTNRVTSETIAPESPIFANLSAWVPTATWGVPQVATEETPYGSLSGRKVEGKVAGSNNTGNDNLRNQPFMQQLGFTQDIQFAADGPGASNWGYSKTENGLTQVVIFGYSSNRLLGPENTDDPYVNFSVFVSDPFTKSNVKLN